MSNALVDKVYIGLDNAPAAFDIKGRILGANGTNLEYIRSETGVIAILKGDKFEPLHLTLHHTRAEALAAARSLALNLIETVRAELSQCSARPPSPAPPPSAPPPALGMRPPAVLQLVPQQQQYVLNQESGQLIPIVQPGMQVSNSNFASLQQLGALQQPGFGTQLVDMSGQPLNLGQLRLSGMPSSMILPNGYSVPPGGSDTTTVSSAMSTPVVCAAPSSNSQKILYSTDKNEKTDVKYHIQGGESVQWSVPGAQTMLIPYQQLQELSGQTGLANLQPQQYVSLSQVGGLPQTSLTAAQLQQLQASGTIMPIHQKPAVSSTSLINIISTGQASSPQIHHNSTPPKSSQPEARAVKRLADGSPSLQLRPIAPAGSGQDKAGRDSRTSVWSGAVRENVSASSMGMKINPAHGTIIHVSSGQQTSAAGSQDGGGMFLRQVDRNSIQLQPGKEIKQEAPKLQPGHNVQMISVPSGVTLLQPQLGLALGQGHSVLAQGHSVLGQGQGQTVLGQGQTVLGQGQAVLGPGGQLYMLPPSGQNLTVLQPNQLSGSVQYNTQYLSPPQYVVQTGGGLQYNLAPPEPAPLPEPAPRADPPAPATDQSGYISSSSAGAGGGAYSQELSQAYSEGEGGARPAPAGSYLPAPPSPVPPPGYSPAPPQFPGQYPYSPGSWYRSPPPRPPPGPPPAPPQQVYWQDGS